MKTKIHTTNYIGISVFLLTCTVLFLSCSGCRSGKINGVSIQTDTHTDSSQLVSSGDTTAHFDIGVLKDAPMLPLTEVDIKDVYDHYILKDTGWQQIYHLYDGKRQQTVDFSGPDVHIQVSRNQKYLTKMTLIQNKMSNQYFLDVELRDCSNNLIVKQSIPSAYQDYYDEFRDEIVPFDGGTGFIQMGRRLGYGLWVAGYKIENGKFIRKFQFDYPDGVLIGLKVNTNGDKIALITNTRSHFDEKDTLKLYDIDHGLIWKKRLPAKKYRMSHSWEQNYFYNHDDIYLFNSAIDTGKVLRCDFDENLIDSFNVSGSFGHWDFVSSKEGEILFLYSKKYLYIYNTISHRINEIDLYSQLKVSSSLRIDIRNTVILNESQNKRTKYIFTIHVMSFPKGEEYFSGIAFYETETNAIKVYKTTSTFMRLFNKNDDILLKKYMSDNFTEKIIKIDL